MRRFRCRAVLFDLDGVLVDSTSYIEESGAGRGRSGGVRVPGAVQLLAALPPGSWAVATSGPRAAAVDRLCRAGLPTPSVLISAEDVLRGKPSPDVYLQAAASLGVAPSECVVVEDAPAGVESARAAGMAVIALTTTHLREELAADSWAGSLAAIHLQRTALAGGEAGLLELTVD